MSGSAGLLMGLAPVFGAPAAGLAIGAGLLEGALAYRQGEDRAGAYEAHADNARRQAKNRAAQEREKYRRLASSHRAALGASGVDVNVGSPLDALAATEAEGEVAALRRLHEGELEASGLRQRAASSRRSGKSALAGALAGGTATGLLAAGYKRPAYWGFPKK